MVEENSVADVKKSKTQKVNAVIPIQYNGINIGAVFVEHLDIRNFDSIKSKKYTR